jgi:uncharacterized membrane protein
VFSIVLGVVAWLFFILTPAGEEFPAQLAGLLGAVVGMLVGSYGRQAIADSKGRHYEVADL